MHRFYGNRCSSIAAHFVEHDSLSCFQAPASLSGTAGRIATCIQPAQKKSHSVQRIGRQPLCSGWPVKGVANYIGAVFPLSQDGLSLHHTRASMGSPAEWSSCSVFKMLTRVVR